MTVSVNDAWGQLWLSCFDEVGKIIMGGRTAGELHDLHDKAEAEGGEYKAQEEQIFTDALCKQYLFRCTAKADNYGDQQRVRYSVRSAAPLDYAAEARKLIDAIKLYE